MSGVSGAQWALAAAALGCGLLLGELGGRLVRQALRRPGRSDSARANARAAGSFVLWASTAVGLAIAVGILDRDVLADLGRRIEEDLPAVLLGLVTVIAGWAVAVAVGAAVGQSALRATGVRHPALERSLRAGITVGAVALALTQVGVDPVVVGVLLVVAAGAPALAAALLTASGGRAVAAQLAAGRALRPQLREGWWLQVPAGGTGGAEVAGRVVALHPTSVELVTEDGHRALVPNHVLLDRPFTTHP